MRGQYPLRDHLLYRRDLDFLLIALGSSGIFLWLLLHVDDHAIRWIREMPYWRLAGYQMISHLGHSGLVLWPLGISLLLLMVIRRLARENLTRLFAAALIVRLGAVFLAVAIPGLVVTLLKRLIGRARPTFLEELGHLTFTPFAKSAYYASLPSGHATTVFALAVVLGQIWPTARMPLLAAAAFIASTRVSIGVHYPSDVFAGALIGSIGAWLVIRTFASHNRGFYVTPDQSIHARPMPSLGRLKKWRDGVTRSITSSMFGGKTPA